MSEVYCSECKMVFREDDLVREQGFRDEVILVCPICGNIPNDFVEPYIEREDFIYVDEGVKA